MKILVAEDDRVTRLRIGSLLGKWGHEVVQAENGAIAWELFQQHRNGLVLTDWNMPEMNGLELVRKIRDNPASEADYTYVIMLTSKSETSDLVEGLEAGADDFIRKPFNNDELRARIRAGVRMMDLERTLADRNRSLELANAKIRASNQRMRRELEAAARIQGSFLPSSPPQLAGARFAWHYEPCKELSGDTFHIVPFDERRVGLFVIDVSGHGVSAALLSVHLSRLLTRQDDAESILHEGVAGTGSEERPLASPAHVASRLNRLFLCQAEFGEELQYFTMLYGILDLDRRRFDFTSAGHPGPIHIPGSNGGKATILEATPPGVGLFPDAEFTEQSLPLESGDRFYLYTDGLFEAVNREGEQVGEERVAATLSQYRAAPLDQTLVRAIDGTHHWTTRLALRDDMSLLGVEIA